MKRTRATWPALTARRSLPLTAALAGMATIGLTLAACGEAGPQRPAPPAWPGPLNRPPVTNWLVKTNQMWTSNDFAALDQVTTGQMRTIYRSEQRQASLPANASRMAFQLTGLSITVPCHTGSPAIFVAYADKDVFDLWTGVQHVAMVFQRGRPVATGHGRHPSRRLGLASPVHYRNASRHPACARTQQLHPDLARVLTRAAAGAAQTSDTHSAPAGLSARSGRTAARSPRPGPPSRTTRPTPSSPPTPRSTRSARATPP
jgi:hypothetical protein